jgi:hypothetical protein
VSLFARFLQQNPNGFGGGGGAGNVSINLLPQTVVRTGTGSIRMAASGNVDLTGGSPVTYINGDGTATSVPSLNQRNIATQLGGAAIYTAGRPAGSISETLRDPVTNAAVTISAPAPTGMVCSQEP